MYSGRKLGVLNEQWKDWRICKEELIVPGGWSLTPDRIIAGNALLEINAENDRQSKAIIIRAARLLRNIN
ncbi:DUF3653 domain-containing protein [Photobacterium sp. SDRW27]|uniref:DUF3653 domain-containing protein n=1 Tax=Photobacterium obscurum TaxID=2829490 RepID=UPI0022448710|nr:DUF3653 domain-containing protein [Photobacterium obscurum]MCW8329398.1 DUF3653 domain-containing protein [Photobacterium obscurum]